jgi:hypothetical protein
VTALEPKADHVGFTVISAPPVAVSVASAIQNFNEAEVAVVGNV